MYYIDAATDIEIMTSHIMHYLAGISGTDPSFLKDAIVASALIEYCPTYKVRSNYTAVWTASFGYRKQVPENYYDSSGNAKTRYRTEIDWKPANGQSEGAVDYFLCAAEGCADYVQRYINAHSIPKLQAATPEIEEENSTKFTRPQDKNFDEDQKLLENDRILNHVKQHRQGDVDRDWSVNWKSSRKKIRCLLPITTVTLSWQGKTFKYVQGCWEGATISGDDPPSGGNFNKLRLFSVLSLLLAFTSCMKAAHSSSGSEENVWFTLFCLSFAGAGLFASLNKWRDEVKRRPYMKPEDIKFSFFDKVVAFWERLEKK